MTAPPRPAPVQLLSGHNRISTQALTSLARTAAASALGVESQDVRVQWTDDDGFLALSLVSPIGVPPLRSVAGDPGRVTAFGGSIRDRAVAAKAQIMSTVTALSGAQLSRVDIRISGARIREGGRVQ